MEEKFFTTEQVANILQVHPFTILKFIKEGKLKGIKLGRVYRIKESDINKFLEDRMTEPKRKKKKTEEETQKKVEKKKEEIPKPDSESFKLKEKGDDDNYYII